MKINDITQIDELNKLSKQELLDLLSTSLKEQEISKAQWNQLHCYFNKLGTDPAQNIQIIVEHLGQILGSDCALYNRLELIDSEDILSTWAIYNEPPQFQRVDKASGHICYEAVIKEQGQRRELNAVILENLTGTEWEKSDINVKKYALKSYLGFPVTYDDKFVGSLCVVDTHQRMYTATEIQIISTLAKAIGVEEVRKKYIDDLKASIVKIEENLDEIKRINMDKDKLYSIISHDLRTPLSGILSLVELLKEDIASLEREQVIESVNMIYTSTNQLFELLENLLEWSQLQTHHIAYFPTLFDLYVVIHKNISLFSVVCTKKEITIVNQIERGTLVYADKNMLHTVIRNLLSNAIKFTPIGGRIVCSSVVKMPWVEVIIADNGVGMSEQVIQNIFKTNVKPTTLGTAGEKGTGLGLALCRELIEKNQGTLFVKSQLQRGTSFHFTVRACNII